MTLRRFLITIAIVTAIVLLALIWLFPSDDDFLAGNPFWNGTSEVISMLPITSLDSLSTLHSLPPQSTLILIPYVEFSPQELDELLHFVAQGGTMVLADDYGFGNQVLEYMGLEVRFRREVLFDPLLNYKNKWFPRIYNLSSSNPVTANSDNVVFNHATALVNVEANDVLAMSSSISFLDLNGNEQWDSNEPTGPLPVISEHNVGEGMIVLIADPSIIINSMQDKEGNKTLIHNIAALTESQVFIAQSHLSKSNLHEAKLMLASIRNYCSIPIVTSALIIVAMVTSLIPIWHPKETGEEKKQEEAD